MKLMKPGPTFTMPDGTVLALDEETMATMDKLDTIADTVEAGPATLDCLKNTARAALDLYQQLEADRVIAKEPYLDACTGIDAWAKQFTKRCAETQQRIKAKLGAYAVAVEKQRRALELEQIRAEEAAAQAKPQAGRLIPPLLPQSPLPDLPSIPTRTTKDVKILDMSKIPREYLMPDLKRIEADLKQGKQIPGVELIDVVSVVTR